MSKNTAFAAEAEQMDHVRTVIDSMTADMRDHPDPRLAMEAMLEAVAKAVCAEAGTLWFYHRFEDGRISPMAVYGGGELEGIYLLPGEGIAGQVVDSGEALVIPDCRQDTRWTRKVDTETGYVTRTVLCVPLKTEDMVFGAIQLINKAEGRAFDRQDLAFTQQLAQEISHRVQDHPLLRDYHAEGGAKMGLVMENDARRCIIEQISTYMDPAIVHEILRKDGKHKKSIETEYIAVLFADVRGFTHLAENLTPAQLISCLSDFLALTSRCVHRHGGIVDKFMGDCTMAYWRLNEDPEAVANACKAALAIQREAQDFAARLYRQTGLEIGLGIGVHAGPALLCHVGDEQYMAYTAIGDVVNTASRLEDNAPSGSIYISHTVAEQRNGVGTAAILEGGILLKGKESVFEVWQLTE